MPALPGIRLIQLGLRSFGTDPGQIDGWWGPKTSAAAKQVLDGGWPDPSVWAIEVLQRGLDDLGWHISAIDGIWGPLTNQALQSCYNAGGRPRAAAKLEDRVVDRPITEGPAAIVPPGVAIKQGSVVVNTIYLHTTATPGSWIRGKTNQQMMAEITRWHTDPKSAGGRGWQAVGYHGVIFPDGGFIQGREYTRTGAGVANHNSGSVHFSMVPVNTITRMGVPTDFYTAATIATVKAKLEEVSIRTPITRLRGHNEDSPKLCPGFVVVDAEWTTRPVS